MRRRTIIAVGVATGAAIALYAAYWWVAAGEFRTGIERWKQARRAEGWTVSHGDLRIEGFPFRLRARVAAPVIAAPRPAPWRWRAPALTATARPWAFDRIVLAAPDGHRLDVAGNGAARPPVVIDSGPATGTARTGPDGRIAVVEGALTGLAAAPADGSWRARIGALDATVALAGGGRTISATARHIEFPETKGIPLEAPVRALALDAAFTGPLGPGPPVRALTAWRVAGGAVEMSRLVLDWPPLRLDAEGTLALDGDMQPMGAMSARIAGYRETLDALVAAGLVRPRDAVAAKLVLGMLSAAPKEGGPAGRIPLTVQNRRLYVGPVPLLRFRPVVWE